MHITVGLFYFVGDYIIQIKKKYTPPEVVKALALGTIHTRYPEDQWLHVYTDGSLQNPEEGAGITCKLFSFYKTMGKNTTHC